MLCILVSGKEKKLSKKILIVSLSRVRKIDLFIFGIFILLRRSTPVL